jgi:hypothetical protein
MPKMPFEKGKTGVESPMAAARITDVEGIIE